MFVSLFQNAEVKKSSWGGGGGKNVTLSDLGCLRS